MTGFEPVISTAQSTSRNPQKSHPPHPPDPPSASLKSSRTTQKKDPPDSHPAGLVHQPTRTENVTS
jgi:hypothetical protein